MNANNEAHVKDGNGKHKHASLCLCFVFVDSVPFSVYEADWCNTDGDFVGFHVSEANTGLDVESHSSRPAEEELRHSRLCISGQ